MTKYSKIEPQDGFIRSASDCSDSRPGELFNIGEGNGFIEHELFAHAPSGVVCGLGESDGDNRHPHSGVSAMSGHGRGDGLRFGVILFNKFRERINLW